MTTLPNGQIIPPAVPAHVETHVQKMEGSAVDAASQKNLASVAAQAAQAKHLGAGQKGGRMKGGSNVVPFNLPEGNTIKGVSHANVHEAAGNLHAQILADKSGDSLINANPIQLGGRRKMSKTKRNGRSHKRANRRKRRRTTRRHRRNHNK